MSVLLVEDEYLIRLLLIEELTHAGFQVVEAESGVKASDLLPANSGTEFSLLITDVHMPGHIDGLEVARHVRERYPKIPIIYMTGRPEAVVAISSCGPREALLFKPFLPSDLIKVARGLIQV